MRRHAAPLVLLGLLHVAGVAGTLLLPRLNADLIDDGVAQGDQATIWRLGGWMLALSLGQLVVAALAMALGSRIAVLVGRDLRADVFTQVMRFGAGEVRRFGPASLITRSGNDVTQVQMLVLTVCTVLVSVPLTAVGAVVMGVREEPGLAWLMAVAVPALVAVVVGFAWLSLPGHRRLQEQIDQVNGVLREQLTGLRVVRAATRERHEQRRFDEANDALIRTSRGVGGLYLSLGPVVALLLSLASVAVVWFGGHRVAAGDMGIGSVTAFIAYLLQLMSAVLMASAIVMQLPRARVSAARLRELLDVEPDLQQPARPRPWATPGSGLELRHATLHRPGAEQPVLRDVDLTLRPGEHVAVVGSTGSGKTTLLQVLSRQLRLTSGSARLDGTDLDQTDLCSARRRVALVPQRAHLFAGTIASNLRYGAPEADDDLLWSALRTAQVDDVVAALPGGLDAPVLAGGTTLSGGQRQRICLARALVARPDHYLLDDATCALDACTEAALLTALREWTRDAGVLSVSQRLSSVRRADRIVVLDRGAVVGHGTHEQLLDDCPTYLEFVDSQSLTEVPA
ncbi:ABC transporter ATP-binding protein [Modestobacter italicus]|uniref:ABC transporter ATP-binding protein n=1 Tax=Modestobacter italicus (strain DSM 44449 / CECT 9708 / BC 501) TaxID=2732864 RepID=UPI001C939092|nr:ABC transporter ATP-binding protein [Modestobacter italicus]